MFQKIKDKIQDLKDKARPKEWDVEESKRYLKGVQGVDIPDRTVVAVEADE